MSRAAIVPWVMLMLLGATFASAEPMAYEGFDYQPPGIDLQSRGGGDGFSGSWHLAGYNASSAANYDIGDGSLEYGDLATEGNRVQSLAVSSIRGVGRYLAAPIQSAETTTRYFSLLLRPEGILGAGQFNGFFGMYLDASTDVFIGKPGSGTHYVIENRGGGGQYASNVEAQVDETVLLVLKSEFTPGLDRFTLYVNPPLGGDEPATGVVKYDQNVGVVDRLILYSTGAFSADEIRVGNTFADVTPVPEPSTLVLLGMGLAALFFSHRRRGNGVRMVRTLAA